MKKYYISAIVFLSFNYACNTNKIDKRIALKIGKLEITKYEFDKNKERGLKRNHGNRNINDSKKVLQWKKEYLNNCFIVADAYEKKYDTIKTIQKIVKNISRIMMVQKYGYLWKRNISPIVDSFKLITPAKAEKRKKMFYFDFIRSKNYQGLKEITANDTIIRTLKEYNKLKNKCYLYPILQTGYTSQQWPFISYWGFKDYLYNMKEGEVSKLLSYEGDYYYFYLDHIENIELTQKDKDNCQFELTIGIENEIENKQVKEMEYKCHPIINDANVDRVANYISNNHSIFEFKNNIELLRYELENKEKELNFNTFLEYYSYLIMKQDIDSKEILIEYLHQYCYDDFLNNEAEKLGLYKTDTFLLDQKNYKNNVLNDEYIQRNIVSKIMIDSAEIIAFYNNNKIKFKQPKKIVFDLYIFNNRGDAFESMNKISGYLKENQNDKTHDTSIVTGLKGFKSNFEINLESNNDYSKEFVNLILTMDIKSLSKRPVPLNKQYVLIYKKNTEGVCIRKLKDVYSLIESQLKYDEINSKIKVLISELNKKYKVEIDKTGI
jgi:hypothetical protein